MKLLVKKMSSFGILKAQMNLGKPLQKRLWQQVVCRKIENQAKCLTLLGIEGTKELFEMMKKSYDILVDHPINTERKKKGLHPANSCWFWGAGTKPALSSFEEKTGKKGL